MSKNANTKISTWQLIFLSAGSMVGSGWLFSPYYGFQAAGVWVLLSWLIIAIATAIIGLTFAEVGGILPIVGGVSRFIGVTHNRSTSFIFLSLGWLSYVVYLPLEAESAVQYLGFWFHSLVIHHGDKVGLSYFGIWCTVVIVILITWFNTLFIARVAKANLMVSIWKLIIPISIAIGFILYFGSTSNIKTNYHLIPLSLENVGFSMISQKVEAQEIFESLEKNG